MDSGINFLCKIGGMECDMELMDVHLARGSAATAPPDILKQIRIRREGAGAWGIFTSRPSSASDHRAHEMAEGLSSLTDSRPNRMA